MSALHISWQSFWQGNYVGKHWQYVLAQLDDSIETASPEVKNEILKFAPAQVKEHYYKSGYIPKTSRHVSYGLGRR